MASLLIRRRSGCFFDDALLAAKRLVGSSASAVHSPPLPATPPPPPPPPYVSLFARAGSVAGASAVQAPLLPAPPPPPPPPYITPAGSFPASRGVAGASVVHAPLVAAHPSPPSPPPPPPYIVPYFARGWFPSSRGVASMGRSMAPPGLWYLRSSIGAWRHHFAGPSKPQSRPQAKKDNKPPPQYRQEKKKKKSKQYPKAQASAQAKKLKLSQQYPKSPAKRAKVSTGEQQNNNNMKKWRRKKKPKKRLEPLRRTVVWRPALYGPKLDLPATLTQEWKLNLAAKATDCFGEADIYPKFDSIPFLKCNPMLAFRGVPGAAIKDDIVPLVPDDMKYLVRSLPKLLCMLHMSGYCIEEEFTLDDLVISGQFKFFLKGHLTLVPCTPERMNHDYSRAGKVTKDMFRVSCGEGSLCLIPTEMKNYLKVLESGGHRCIYLILTHIALLPMDSRVSILVKFHNEILEVLPREGLEDMKNKILGEIDITSWDTIAQHNKHLSTWFRYRAEKEGKPYNPKKPSHFLSLQRNVIAHRNQKRVFEDGVIDIVLYGCYPVQLCQMQEALWRHNSLIG